MSGNIRFIIKAGQCLTFYNEFEGDFQKKNVPDTAHNALIGCLRCQLVCPVNRPFTKKREIVETFNEEETALIMNDTFHGSPGILEKLKNIDMIEYENVLSRNLNVLLK